MILHHAYLADLDQEMGAYLFRMALSDQQRLGLLHC